MSDDATPSTQVSGRTVLGLPLGTLVLLLFFVFGLGVTWAGILSAQGSQETALTALKTQSDANLARVEQTVQAVNTSVIASVKAQFEAQAVVTQRDKALQDQVSQHQTQRISAIEGRLPSIDAAETSSAQLKAQQAELTRRLERVENDVGQIPQMITLLRVMEERSSNQASLIREQGELTRRILDRLSTASATATNTKPQ